MPSNTLERVQTGNPFVDHPQLRAIWDREWSGPADSIAGACRLKRLCTMCVPDIQSSTTNYVYQFYINTDQGAF